MKILQILKKYMVPFFSEYGFKNIKVDNRLVVFEHAENPELKISFSIIDEGKYQGIRPELKRGKEDRLNTYPLTLFLDEPLEIYTTYRDEYWHVDTEEELVGALEEQVNLLKGKAFDWLFQRSDLDIDAMITKKINEWKSTYLSADYSEKIILASYIRVKAREWENRRVKPVKWKFN
jgi:hypothetical protein